MRAEDFFSGKAATNPAFKAAWDAEAPISVLALNLYRLRKALRLTQAEFGAKAGLSQPKIAKIERGDANPELRTIGRIAGALGVSVGELLSDPFAQKRVGDSPEVHRETLATYEVATFHGFEFGPVIARRAPVLRKTQAIDATRAATDNFALAG